MVGIPGLLILIVLGLFLVAVVVVPIILFIRYKEGGHGGEGSPAAIIGIIVAVGLVGLVVLVAVVALGAFFFTAGTRGGGPQAAEVQAPIQVTIAPAEAARPVPRVEIETQKGVAFDTPSPVAISLALSRPQDDGAEPGQFVIEITNRTDGPFSPSSLQNTADDMAWHVEVNGKTSYDSVNWKQEEFGKEVPSGQKGLFRIEVPLKTIKASTGDTIVVYYRCDQEGGRFTIRSNKLQL